MTRGKRMFFFLEGVDINNDVALEAFARQVWERFTQSHPRPQAPEDPETPESPEDPHSS